MRTYKRQLSDIFELTNDQTTALLTHKHMRRYEKQLHVIFELKTIRLLPHLRSNICGRTRGNYMIFVNEQTVGLGLYLTPLLRAGYQKLRTFSNVRNIFSGGGGCIALQGKCNSQFCFKDVWP